MDAHYDSQIKSTAQTTFMGPARQMGSGGGIGAFAVRMGRVAIPIVKKYILPVAKQVGKNLLDVAIPELGQVLTGKKKANRKLLTHVAKSTAAKTVKTASFPVKSAGAPRRAEKADSARSAPRGAGGRVPTLAKKSRKRPLSESLNISKKSPAKRSRSDILSEIQFSSN